MSKQPTPARQSLARVTPQLCSFAMLASHPSLPSVVTSESAFTYPYSTLPSHTCTRNAQKRRLKKALTVTFSSQVEVARIVSLHSMEQGQVASVYYNEEDRKECKEDIAVTLRAIRHRTALDPTTQDTRGLEHLISQEVYTELVANKNAALRAVIEAQDADSAPDHIARAYSETTAEAADRAQRRAKRDAFEATMNQRDWSNDPFAFFKTMNQSNFSLE